MSAVSQSGVGKSEVRSPIRSGTKSVSRWAWRNRELLWYALVVVIAALGEWWASGISGAWR
jgi:hypothetical protein